ncbi:MAG: hypothetical protein RR695_04785 [Clostridium sp.]
MHLRTSKSKPKGIDNGITFHHETNPQCENIEFVALKKLQEDSN